MKQIYRFSEHFERIAVIIVIFAVYRYVRLFFRTSAARRIIIICRDNALLAYQLIQRFQIAYSGILVINGIVFYFRNSHGRAKHSVHKHKCVVRCQRIACIIRSFCKPQAACRIEISQRIAALHLRNIIIACRTHEHFHRLFIGYGFFRIKFIGAAYNSQLRRRANFSVIFRFIVHIGKRRLCFCAIHLHCRNKHTRKFRTRYRFVRKNITHNICHDRFRFLIYTILFCIYRFRSHRTAQNHCGKK